MTDSEIPAEAVRSLDQIGVGIARIEVITPTLDDAFLALTGRHVDEQEPEEVAA